MGDSAEWVMISEGVGDDAWNQDMAYNELMNTGPTQSPASTFSVEGVHYVLRYAGEEIIKKAAMTARCTVKCNACVSRAKEYVRDAGPDGALFLANIREHDVFKRLALGEQQKITEMRKLAVECCGRRTMPVPIVVTSDTYAPAQEGSKGEQKFFHWTISPEHITADEKVARFHKLKHYFASIDTRLSKLTEPEANASVEIMVEEQASLVRPGHWTSVLKWVQQVQAKAGKKPFSSMAEEEKIALRIFAIMTGRVDNTTHLDFHQSENIVDFLLCPSREALRQEMDSRSDPNTYMVSQLNRRLCKESVTSPHIVGLAWSGEFKDDLDLHVVTPQGHEVFYGKPEQDGCKLDFDANVRKGEAEPCENVSVCPGTYKVYVNNFTRRTFNAPIPFQIICRSVGKTDVIHDGFWCQNRAKGDKILVCTHTFSAENDSVDLQLSENASRRALAQAAEWESRIGVPVATVSTIQSIRDKKMLLVLPDVSTSRAGIKVLGDAVNQSFLSRIASPKKKQYLSENCRRSPSSFGDLVKLLKNECHTLSINLRDHPPGYLVDIMTQSDGVRKSNLPVPCHYNEKYAPPQKPSVVGNARLDSSWLRFGQAASARVCAITQLEETYFLALQDATLPESDSFPLGGGFYPTDLSADFHQHRERWTYFHTQLRPSISDEGSPMIGCFLVGKTAKLSLDGVQLTVTV